MTMDRCDRRECSYAGFCRMSAACIAVTKESRKGIANSVAHFVCDDWKILSVSSLLESDGRRLESVVHERQESEGCTPCFRAPY